MLGKIALIGTGNIGAVLIQEIARRGLAKTVAAVDIKEPDVAKGKSLAVRYDKPCQGEDLRFI